MSDMTREQVLAWAKSEKIIWPTPGYVARKMMGIRFDNTGWTWGVTGSNDEAILSRDFSASITQRDVESYVDTQWNGEGLPPVGEVVEFRDHGAGVAVTAHIVAHHINGKEAIWSEHAGDGVLNYGSHGEFRPIRSEREKAVEEAMKDIDAEDGDTASILGVVERMVAAGYRKEKS